MTRPSNILKGDTRLIAIAAYELAGKAVGAHEGITGSLTANRIPVATGAKTVNDSWLIQVSSESGDYVQSDKSFVSQQAIVAYADNEPVSGGGGGGAVDSVFGRTGVVVAVSGDYTTTIVPEGTNLYFTDQRAIDAIKADVEWGDWLTGSLTAGKIPVASGAKALDDGWLEQVTAGSDEYVKANKDLVSIGAIVAFSDDEALPNWWDQLQGEVSTRINLRHLADVTNVSYSVDDVPAWNGTAFVPMPRGDGTGGGDPGPESDPIFTAWKDDDTRIQKTFLAAPNDATGAATFRTILASDIPALDYATEAYVNSGLDAIDESKWDAVEASCATTNHPRWNEHATHYGVDAFNFRALPGGNRAFNALYYFIGVHFFSWTASEHSSEKAYRVYIPYSTGGVFVADTDKKNGFSVRAVRDATVPEQALSDGIIIEDAYTDNAGNIYEGVKMGLQVWTRHNLQDTKYADDSLIPTDLSNGEWTADTTGAMAVYPHGSITGLDSEAEVVEAYGRLYNWYAVDNAKGVINPADGWHVPTDAEWTQLTDYIIALGTYTSSTVGNALKSFRQVNSPHVSISSISPKGALTPIYVNDIYVGGIRMRQMAGGIEIFGDLYVHGVVAAYADDASPPNWWDELASHVDGTTIKYENGHLVVIGGGGATTWAELDKTTSSLADITTRSYNDLQDKPTLPQASAQESHQFLRAYSTDTGQFTKARPTWANIDEKPTAFNPADHTLIGDHHTVSGLTVGHFLKAVSATYYQFSAIAASDISDVRSNSQNDDWYGRLEAINEWTDKNYFPAIAVGKTAVTEGYVVDVSGNILSDGSAKIGSLEWDNTNKRLGVNITPAAGYALHVKANTGGTIIRMDAAGATDNTALYFNNSAGALNAAIAYRETENRFGIYVGGTYRLYINDDGSGLYRGEFKAEGDIISEQQIIAYYDA